MIILNNNRIKIEYKTNSFKKLAIIGQGAGGRARLSNDIIYNVFSMNHTGSINGQVFPGLMIGAIIKLKIINYF